MNIQKETIRYNIIKQLNEEDALLPNLVLSNAPGEVRFDNSNVEKSILFNDFNLLAKFITKYDDSCKFEVLFEDYKRDLSYDLEFKNNTTGPGPLHFVEKIEFLGENVIFMLESFFLSIGSDGVLKKEHDHTSFEMFYNVKTEQFDGGTDSICQIMSYILNTRSKLSAYYTDFVPLAGFRKSYDAFCKLNKLSVVDASVLWALLSLTEPEVGESRLITIVDTLLNK